MVYPWSTAPLYSVRGANLDYCADLSVDEVTEEDLEICEVVCKPAKVKECAKVTSGETDEDGLQIWEDDPESCVEMVATDCKVQEIPAADEEDGEGVADVSEEEEVITTESTTEEMKKDNSAFILFPDD